MPPLPPNVEIRDNRCPECGRDLRTTNPRKHSIEHYGERPIPYDPKTYVARARQAALDGKKLPED